MDDRQIVLFDPAGGESSGQRTIGLGGPGDDHRAARPLVQTVHDTGPARAPDAGDLGETPQQPVRESSGGLPGTRVDGEAGRFIEHDQVVVEKEQAELALFRQHAGLAALGWIPRNALAGSHEMPRLGPRDAVHRQVAGADPLLDLVARQVEMAGQGAIEPDSGFVLADPPGAAVHGRLRNESRRITTRPIEIALSATLKSGQR